MSEQGFQDKTEPATPKKKEDARKKGQVAKSREISSIAVLATGTIYMFFCAKDLTLKFGEVIKQTFKSIPQSAFDDQLFLPLISDMIEQFLLFNLPIMLLVFIAALLANYMQTGFILSVEPLTPKASKIDPIKGCGKIISKRSLAELAKAIFKIIIVGWAAFSTLKNDIHYILPLMYQENTHIIFMLGDISFRVIMRCCCVIFILAILDFIYQKWEFEQNQKMTKQEVKDELKQTEGDPLVKSRIRSIQREMARRRMMEEVPKADVVITNPTHISVALCYNHEENMTAPRIVAKGANKVAFKIREVAEKHNIPLIENKSLAQNLYKLDIGEEIPPQFYQAVAEILAYVYGLKKQKAHTG